MVQPMRVVAYVRVSTEEQAALSPAAQRAKIAAYAALYDLDVVRWCDDPGLSAKTLNRPGLEAALAALDAGEARGLVVAKLDRLTRHTGDWAALIERYFGERAGKTLLSVTDSIDTRTANGCMALNMLMTIAQWEREIIAERTRDALAHKATLGHRCGSLRYGHGLSDAVRSKTSGRPNLLTEDAAEQAVIARMVELRGQGLSYHAIAAALDADGIPTKKGRPRWSGMAVWTILRRIAGEAA